VITFSDIHSAKAASEVITKLNQELKISYNYANNIFDTVRDALLVLDKELKVISANRSFYKIFNTDMEKTIGKYIFDLDDKKWEISKLRQLLEQIIPKNNFFEDFEVEYVVDNETSKKLLLNARQIYHEDRKTKLILLAMQDRSIK